MGQALPLLALAGTAVSAFGQFQSSQAQARALEQQGQAAQEEAAFRERESRREAEKLKARQRVAFAKGGVITSSGTPIKIAEQTALDAELNALAIRTTGQTAAQAKRTEAGAVRRAGTTQAIGTILSGASKLG